MSTRKGAHGNVKTRAQRHQNRTSFKNDLHDDSARTKMLNGLNICEVCDHCKSVIEWKIKYRKYKCLSQPKTCNKCNQRTVTKAYHYICRACVIQYKQCAKCLKGADDCAIIPPEQSAEEQKKIKIEMEHLIKSLPERKRRTFLRFMKRGKKKEKVEESDDEEGDEEAVDKPKAAKVPHSRNALLQKLEELKVVKVAENDNDMYEDLDSSGDESFGSEDDWSDVD